MNIFLKKTIRHIVGLSSIVIISGIAACGEHKSFSNGSDSIPSDPLNTRMYTLKNGLKVYLSVYKEEPRIQTYIAVKAGSKNDPADATGLAHYLEHMLFKGTDKFGTKDFEKETILINKIDSLYEVYRNTIDESERKKIYKNIDSVSFLASQFAIANEYDKMVAGIGAKGTNAYTSEERTVYINNIPSNQLENWITIEAERFRNPVLRLFHTELEAVYEEKNMSLDRDGDQAYETLMLNLFPNHPYGTQTTIGTIEHLKNPSLKRIKEYYEAYYVPNNMAICISGDIDPDKTIKLIEAHFGSFKNKEVSPLTLPEEKTISSPIEKEISGPDAEFVMIGYRLPGQGTKDALIAELISAMLHNGTAGLFDLNLIQQQKVLEAYSYLSVMNDYSAHILEGVTKENQKLENVKEILLAEIEKIKKGNFPDWLPQAVANDFKLSQLKQLQNNNSRAHLMVEAFSANMPINQYMAKPYEMAKITKQEIIDFANKYYQNNYVVVYKREGEKSNTKKVEKPSITEVSVNREDESPFLTTILANTPKEIEPVFIDYNKDIKTLSLKCTAPLYYSNNKENKLFSLYYVNEMGSNHNPLLQYAVNYLEFLGTTKYTAEEIKQQFYRIGCEFHVSSSEDRTYIYLEGLQENFEESIQLFEHLLANAQPNEEALRNLISDELKARSDNKKNKSYIFWNGLMNYAKYGEKSPFNNVLSNEELKNITSEQLIEVIKLLTAYKHKVLYYGPESIENISTSINKWHNPTSPLLELLPEKEFALEAHTQTNVFVVDYDMKQAEILFFSNGKKFDPQLIPITTLFNEYFGGGMSSIVFQEIREAKALAYSAFSTFSLGAKKDKNNICYAYIGTQADKLPEAMKSMNELLINMPKSDKNFKLSVDAALQKIRTSRITRTSLLFNFIDNERKGITHDTRKDIFEQLPKFSFQDLENFHAQNIKSNHYNIMVLGKKNELNLNTLKKYGKVEFLTLEQIFGY
ncbi:MAG: insulinase family protein [Flavobacteriales bacterium]|nr:insulinase family protein [Flavobacteriales bacterium]